MRQLGFEDILDVAEGSLADLVLAANGGRKVDIVRGYGSFIDPHHIEVEETTGTSQEKTGIKKIIKYPISFTTILCILQTPMPFICRGMCSQV